MCVCVTAVLSSGCAQSVCVFDLTQLLEKQTQSVHPDVDRCAVTSSGTHMHVDTRTLTGALTHIFPSPPRRRTSCLPAAENPANIQIFPQTDVTQSSRCQVNN